jgi:hypothetical protein
MIIYGYSFLEDIIGSEIYGVLGNCAQRYLLKATCVLGVVLILTFIVHWGFISSILNLVTGTSLLFIVYVACAIVYFDKQIEVEIEDERRWMYEITPYKDRKPKGYTKTKVWGIILIIIGISVIYVSNRYRKHYSFECETFLVDSSKGLYHLNGFNKDCEEIEKGTILVPMKGYKIENSNYSFCPCCDEWAEDAVGSFESDRYYRK